MSNERLKRIFMASPFVILSLLNLLAIAARAQTEMSVPTAQTIDGPSVGGMSGGGGDAQEIRLDEIRVDILRWLDGGGAAGLQLPQGMTRESYERRMHEVLTAHHVMVGFITSAQEAIQTDPELRVDVLGQPKTCRGFVSQRDGRPHILCNTERFQSESESSKYQLVHHEYAGLAGVEQNRGASSDYRISRQLTDFLRSEMVVRLALRRVNRVTQVVDTPTNLAQRINFDVGFGGHGGRTTQEVAYGGFEAGIGFRLTFLAPLSCQREVVRDGTSGSEGPILSQGIERCRLTTQQTWRIDHPQSQILQSELPNIISSIRADASLNAIGGGTDGGSTGASIRVDALVGLYTSGSSNETLACGFYGGVGFQGRAMIFHNRSGASGAEARGESESGVYCAHPSGVHFMLTPITTVGVGTRRGGHHFTRSHSVADIAVGGRARVAFLPFREDTPRFLRDLFVEISAVRTLTDLTTRSPSDPEQARTILQGSMDMGMRANWRMLLRAEVVLNENLRIFQESHDSEGRRLPDARVDAGSSGPVVPEINVGATIRYQF